MPFNEGLRPSDQIAVGRTTPGNTNVPLFMGHVDNTALRHDYGADNGSLSTAHLGRVLNPLNPEATRQSVEQSNTGAKLKIDGKVEVSNVFPYRMRPDDHYPPVDFRDYTEIFLTQDGYNNEVIKKHPDIYMLITTAEGLTLAMTTPGKIGIIKSVEGLPQVIDVPVGQAADLLRRTDTLVVDLMWNHNTDVGDSHTTLQDNGLTRKGKEFLRACGDLKIPVFDVSHASEETALDMINHPDLQDRLVVATHTGARIISPQGVDLRKKTRNISDKVAQGIFERGGIVGIATAGGMLGGNELSNVVAAIRHFVNLDPTKGRLVTLGLDLNGLGVESMINGFKSVLDINNIAEALRKAGFAQEQVENIFWKNAYDFWIRALTIKEAAK